MQMALAEERKVTEKLSRNLELEKRRSESLEQKVKGANRRSAGSMSSSNDRTHVPEEIRQRDDQLSISMENYRLHCENLGTSLEECELKLAGFEIQVRYLTSFLFISFYSFLSRTLSSISIAVFVKCFYLQEDYHVADLRKELSNVKKLLSDERRRSNSDSQKISEAQLLFAQVIKDYNGAIENIRQLQQEKRAKVIMNKDY